MEDGSGWVSKLLQDPSHWEEQGAAAVVEEDEEELAAAELVGDGLGLVGRNPGSTSSQQGGASSSEALDSSLFLPSDEDLASRFLREVEGLRSQDLTFGGSQNFNAWLSSCAGYRNGSVDVEAPSTGALGVGSEDYGRTPKLDAMDGDYESEPALRERLPNSLELSASRVREKLPKRTKLLALTSKRRNREAEVFELHVKELRKEMSLASRETVETQFSVMSNQVTDSYDGETRMDLTDDLLHKVFSCLDDTSLCKAAIVCRQWRTASSHEDFWKILNFEGRNVSYHQVRNLCSRYPNAIKLNLRSSVGIEEMLVMQALSCLKGLEVLILGKGSYGDNFFSSLAQECPVLRDLSVSESLLGGGCSQEIQIRHDSLRKLHILKCRVMRVAIRCSQLEELSLRRTGTTAALLACPRLLVLDVSACHKLSDGGLRAAATACPLLSQLDISQCSFVTDETLRDIAAACLNLRSLDATYCPNVSLEGVRMERLVSMTLKNCEGINSSSMVALSDCSMLEEVILDHCPILTTIVLNLPRLRTISVTNCRKFAELTLRCPSLVWLTVFGCPTLHKIDITSTTLQKLVLNQQQGLTTVALQCPWLQEVDLSDCDSLTNSLFEVFSSGGGCPRLSSLILDNCEGLTAVKLSTGCLVSLSLVSCRKVCSLELDCPSLQRLQLDGCDHLTAASLCPVGLRSLNLGICPHLTTLTIRADRMTALDLRGCGILHQAEIVCPSLLSLDASYCSQLGDTCLAATTEACPLIQLLVLAACPAIGPAGLLALRNLRVLTVLDLSYTFLTDLSPIYMACPQLQVLRLSACKYLGNDALAALHGGKFLPDLHELDLSYGSLGRTAIEAVLRECPHLCHVSLNGCSNVYDLDWAGIATSEDVGMTDANDTVEVKAECSPPTEKALQVLNCVGCANIRRVVIPSSAGYVNLCSLNLSLSTNITVVRLACSNLVTLNLSHCLLLVELKLDCPRLTALFLQDSGIEEDELEQSLKESNSLETLDVRNCQKISSLALTRLRISCPGIKRLYSTLLP